MSDSAGLVARTRRLDADVDLLDVAGAEGSLFCRDGIGLAGVGVAATVTVTDRSPAGSAAAVDAVLSAIDTDDRVGLPGCGPVALGALPFMPDAPGTLRVPEVLIGRANDGTRWLTTVGPVDDPRHHAPAEELALAAAGDGSDPGTDFADVTIRASVPADRWRDTVASVRDALRAGDARKVVLARAVDVVADRPIDRHAVLRRLRAGYGTCYVYAAGSLVGASPELLVARTGDIVRAHPMAGTVPRTGDPAGDARLAADLLSSHKDLLEHRITIDGIHDALLGWCSYLDEEAAPSIVAVANVQHLATMLEGRLSAPAASVLELVAALHPTPAVCGDPTDVALSVIAEREGFDRGCYAGPVGWVDRLGQGSWAVGIRCADIDGATARCYAGVGVVAESDPDAELAETQAKLRAMLDAVVRP
ncbi:MAG: isochorismate synthase [Acidimicrobiales bacterium]|nr:isochorismate synthase [Acidimicrobiales bacterium]